MPLLLVVERCSQWFPPYIQKVDLGAEIQQNLLNWLTSILLEKLIKELIPKFLKWISKETNEIYAMKVIKKWMLDNEEHENLIVKQMKTYQKVSNPFIAKIHHVFQTQQKIYIVMDLVKGIKLGSYIKKKFQLQEKEVRFYTSEIFFAIKWLHEDDVIHWNLNPNNILIDSDGHIKINLCKTAQSLEQPLLSQTSGSSLADYKENKTGYERKSNFVAPEVLSNEKFSHSADWWSLGAMIHQMISGYPPFQNSSHIINNQIRYSK